MNEYHRVGVSDLFLSNSIVFKLLAFQPCLIPIAYILGDCPNKWCSCFQMHKPVKKWRARVAETQLPLPGSLLSAKYEKNAWLLEGFEFEGTASSFLAISFSIQNDLNVAMCCCNVFAEIWLHWKYEVRLERSAVLAKENWPFKRSDLTSGLLSNITILYLGPAKKWPYSQKTLHVHPHPHPGRTIASKCIIKCAMDYRNGKN